MHQLWILLFLYQVSNNLTIHAKQKQQNMLESRSGGQGKPKQVTASRCVALDQQSAS